MSKHVDRVRVVLAVSASLLGFGELACKRTERSDANAPTPPSPSFTYTRRYTPGSSRQYRLLLEYLPAGGVPFSQTTVSRHDETARGERITFEGLSRVTAERKEDWSSIARSFRGYEASIAPGCSECLALPDLATTDAHLTEPITDIHTFLVAVSPQGGVDRVHRVGDRYAVPKQVVGRWADGTRVPIGEDCITMEIVLTALEETTATFVTSFLPPAVQCIIPARPPMTAPVTGGGPNNFQQIEIKSASREAMWGREQFVVTTRVRRSDGVILDARMNNELDLVMRTGCEDESLEHCRAEVPVKLRRKLAFQLVEGGANSAAHLAGVAPP